MLYNITNGKIKREVIVMSEWNELMQNKFFITDLGAEQNALVNGKQITIGRYAVWSPSKNASQHTIVEVSSDLNTLAKKYSVSDDRVCRLSK